MSGSRVTIVSFLPYCTMCKKPAVYFVKLPGGRWVYVCREHFKENKCTLGAGHGQTLMVHFDGLPSEIQKKAVINVRNCAASGIKSGCGTLTDTELIQYIHRKNMLFYGDGWLVV